MPNAIAGSSLINYPTLSDSSTPSSPVGLSHSHKSQSVKAAPPAIRTHASRRKARAYANLIASVAIACLSMLVAWHLGLLPGTSAACFAIGSVIAHMIGMLEVTQTAQALSEIVENR